MSGRYRLLPLLGCLLLSACATAPQQSPAAAATAVVAPVAEASVASLPIVAIPTQAPGFWDQLRASFVLTGCEDNAVVAHWAARYTAHPQRFDARLKNVLPELRYIADAVHSQNIPGEFVFLPWVESSYRPLPARGNGAGGMWQIMPRTARSLGLRIDQRYDARLDLHLATHAALRLLQRYDDKFHDWRLADMAYNAGMYGILKLLNARSTPLDDRAIPALPVKPVTRNHLAKLI
ncbi:MAG: lytic transglycosylase domain-containing protein, partial [Xanthomonadales bacterium]|nr:lytic transglycosylase domain-containing protein [Xanthomonadales bacterium]